MRMEMYVLIQAVLQNHSLTLCTLLVLALSHFRPSCTWLNLHLPFPPYPPPSAPPSVPCVAVNDSCNTEIWSARVPPPSLLWSPGQWFLSNDHRSTQRKMQETLEFLSAFRELLHSLALGILERGGQLSSSVQGHIPENLLTLCLQTLFSRHSLTSRKQNCAVLDRVLIPFRHAHPSMVNVAWSSSARDSWCSRRHQTGSPS